MSSAFEEFIALQLEIRALIHDHLKLATLEMRLAAQTFVAMVTTTLCIGALLLMAWAGLMAAIGLGLVRLGFDSVLAMLTVTVLTSGLALLLGMRIRIWSVRLGLPATLRALKPVSPALQSEK